MAQSPSGAAAAQKSRAAAAQSPPALRVRNLTKTFPGQVALRGLDLDIAPGEVHAIVGANGSGKSTFIKCLAGVHHADAGSVIEVAGHRLPTSYPPSEAHHFGFSFVHQDLGLLPNLSVLENLALGRGYKTRIGWRVDWRLERRRCLALLDDHRLQLSPDALVGDLTVVEQTLLAIARSLGEVRDGGKVIVLDEPTAALPDRDAQTLIEAVRRVAGSGVAVIYVSHRLEEIFALADRITVLRDGDHIGTHATAALDRDQLVELIAGRQLDESRELAPERLGNSPAATVLEARDLSGNTVQGVSLQLRSGEVVGLAGLAGSGRSELARLLFGAQRRTGGQIFVNGREADLRSPSDAIRLGIAMVPQDRRRDGCFLALPAGRNMTILSLRSCSLLSFVNPRAELMLQRDLADRFGLRPAEPSRPLSAFSGGNQQKSVLAKWMHRQPSCLIFDEPVQGIDVGAKAEVHRHIDEAARAGAAVLVIDSEFENLSRICDRILVVHRGRILHELKGDQRQRDEIVRAVFGPTDAREVA